MTIDPAAVRRWVAGFRAAAARDRRRPAVPMAPQEAFDAAMELWDLKPELFDEEPDALRLREVDAARRAWARLRERLG
jgi:hypothetical protein